MSWRARLCRVGGVKVRMEETGGHGNDVAVAVRVDDWCEIVAMACNACNYTGCYSCKRGIYFIVCLLSSCD